MAQSRVSTTLSENMRTFDSFRYERFLLSSSGLEVRFIGFYGLRDMLITCYQFRRGAHKF